MHFLTLTLHEDKSKIRINFDRVDAYSLNEDAGSGTSIELADNDVVFVVESPDEIEAMLAGTHEAA